MLSKNSFMIAAAGTTLLILLLIPFVLSPAEEGFVELFFTEVSQSEDSLHIAFTIVNHHPESTAVSYQILIDNHLTEENVVVLSQNAQTRIMRIYSLKEGATL